MANQKVFILLPDGVGLRNFAFTEFYNLGKQQGFDIVFWNNTEFDLTQLQFDEIRIRNGKTNPLTDIYKNARKQIELNLNIEKSGDDIYDSYRFKPAFNNIKSAVKSLATKAIVQISSNQKGLANIRKKIENLERATPLYKQCLETLKVEKPALVFCTNQRHTTAIAPLLAANDLKIPTATFIFSWDNLPKATMVVATDYYFVWSDHMKNELLYYYDFIAEKNIIVTGTPQFESHFDETLVIERQQFFKQNDLDEDKKYICYSGDDITTSPNDEDYLADVSDAVRQLNSEGQNLGIIFRRCPADFSNRYKKVLLDNKDIIVSINPKWKKIGANWSTILPQKEDLALLVNTVRHSEMVINLGSSMVFDNAAHEKPCGFINYDSKNAAADQLRVKRIYQYIHFQSMPSQHAVIWLNNAAEIPEKIKKALINSSENVTAAKKWFEKINKHPPESASARIWESLSEIVNRHI